MRGSFVDKLILSARENKNIVLLTGDLGNGCLEPFAEEFPDRYFNVGIAEQNMMAMASGLAIEGKKVFVYSIGNFDTLRCLEQIRNDVCYMNLDVNIISIGAGLEYGQLGFSHHSTEDTTCLRAMPNMTVFDTATASEVINALDIMLNTSSPCYLRLNKKGVEISAKAPKNMQPYNVINGESFAIFASGTIIQEAIKASEILLKKGVKLAVYSCPMLKPLDSKALIKKMTMYKYVFTLEEQTVIGGFGSAVSEILACHDGEKPVLKMFGINDSFLSTVGDRNYLRKAYKIDADSISKQILKVVK